MKVVKLVCFLIFFSPLIWAGGKEEAMSLARSEYLARRGIIAPADEVEIESFISALDFNYPDPEGELGIYLYPGHRQVSAAGQGEVIIIGIQGKRYSFEDLPPLNLALVIDRSGSMAEPDKIEMVIESLKLLADTVRDRDRIALIAFNDKAEVQFPSTRMSSNNQRERFKRIVEALAPTGDSDLTSGLKAGYEEVLKNFNPDGTNRILLLSDGWGNARGALDLVKNFREQGVEISTIGYGQRFEYRIMKALAEDGGGSSRFISDRDRLEETFGHGLARMSVPLARDIQITLNLHGSKSISTWGFKHQIKFKSKGHVVNYSLPVLHSGDYETIVVQIYIPEQEIGIKKIAVLEAEYTDRKGERHRIEPLELELIVVPDKNPLTGFSDGRVLKAGTMLRIAQALKTIGRGYYRTDYYFISNEEAFFLVHRVKNEVKNARKRLNENVFDKQIELLEQYMLTIGKELSLSESTIENVIADEEIIPEEKRSLEQHMNNLYRELLLTLEKKTPGNIAVSGFSFSDERKAELLSYLNESAATQLFKLSEMEYHIVERQKMDEVLREQELSLSDLVEPNRAIEIGKILAANYLLTGTVIEMSESMVIFSRIINVETAVIEAAAQVIVPLNEQILNLLAAG